MVHSHCPSPPPWRCIANLPFVDGFEERVSRSLFEIESWARHPPSLWLTSWVTPPELSHWPNAQLSRVWQSAVPLPPSPLPLPPIGSQRQHWRQGTGVVGFSSFFIMTSQPFRCLGIHIGQFHSVGPPGQSSIHGSPIPRRLEWIKVHRARRPFGNLVRFMAEFAHFMTFAVAS